jgi:cytochrome c peroxidase
MGRPDTFRPGIGLLLVAITAVSAVTGAVVRASVSPPGAGLRAGLEEFRRPAAVPQPGDNLGSEVRVALGKRLFFDPRLSASGIVSCGTCHNPGFDWGDGLPRAVGHQMKTLARRTPTILNVAWAELLFWDGRAETLEEQALGPIASPDEMAMDLAQMVRTIDDIEGYRSWFARAYPDEPLAKETVAKAIAAFERTVVSGTAPFDLWVAGDEDAVPLAAKRGFQLFVGKAQCSTCHAGWRFTDDSFHDIGTKTDDVGRGKLFEGVTPLRHAFKTPTLRNVDRRDPYMHNGSEHTLADVIALYDAGGRVKRPSLSEEIRPLALADGEKRDLLAFLATLTSDDPTPAIPALPR